MEPTGTDTESPTGGRDDETTGTDEDLATDVLVEEISIDGMCGVY